MTLVPEATGQVAQAGDDVYLGSMLVKLHLWGLVSDLDTPAMMSGSLEVLGDEAALVLDALVGPRGPAGQNAPIVKMQWSSSIRDPAELPRNLLNDPNDIGKAWWIANQVYVWDGNRYQIHAMGTQGPAGPVPRITPNMAVVDGPTGIDVTGTTTHPSWYLRVNRDEVKGPPGPSAAIANADDYDNSEPAEPLKVLTAVQGPTPGSILWGPRINVQRHVRQYTVPEGAFENFIGLTQRHTVLAYQVEPQPYDWVPHVEGHLKVWGADLGLNTTVVGAEVRIGSPVAGVLVGRSHGSIASWTYIHPHFSSPGDPMAATTPSNQVGMVRAGETADLFVSLYNEGLLGAFIFEKSGSQMSILTVAQEAGIPSMTAETYVVPGSFLYNIPDWCTWIDVVMCGAGGGGSDGEWYITGKGGGGGQWFGGTLERGTDIPKDTTQILVTVGDGGVNAPWEAGQSLFPAGNGSPCTIAATGMVTRTALGGLYAANQFTPEGSGPGNFVFMGKTYYGGLGGGYMMSWQLVGDGPPGNPPGGGGAGAGLNGLGGKGGAGQVWMRARR